MRRRIILFTRAVTCRRQHPPIGTNNNGADRHFATPRSSMGEAGSRMLLSLMRGEPVARNCVDLGFELTVRSST